MMQCHTYKVLPTEPPSPPVSISHDQSCYIISINNVKMNNLLLTSSWFYPKPIERTNQQPNSSQHSNSTCYPHHETCSKRMLCCYYLRFDATGNLICGGLTNTILNLICLDRNNGSLINCLHVSVNMGFYHEHIRV